MSAVSFFGLVGLVLACSVGGYFAGREELKWELRSVVAERLVNIQNILADPPRPVAAPELRGVRPTVPLTAALLDKGFHQANPQAGDFESYMTVAVAFENRGDKDIRAFDGVLTFTDLLDHVILRCNISINDLVRIREKLKWNGTMEYNQFLAPDKNFVGEDIANIKLVMTVGKILYSDGSVQVVTK
jgi:hypothetical protein